MWRLAIICDDGKALKTLSSLDFIDIVQSVSPDEDPFEMLERQTLDALLVIIEGSEKVQDRLPALSERIPVLVFTDDDRVEQINLALKNGVTSYVVRGFAPERLDALLKVAVSRFRQSSEERDRLRRIESALTERKSIERAKGLIMQRKQCSEEIAYQALRRLAMSSNRKIAEIAEDVIRASGRL